jgi:aspartate racemase
MARAGSKREEGMKKIGIVGGVAWPSTVEYYSEICRGSERWHKDHNLPGMPSTPEMTIESLDINKAVSYLGIDGDEASWLRFDEYHRSALERLEAGGADFAIIASNTPHHRFEAIVRGVAIPVLNIFEVTAKESARIGAAQVLIIGTNLTMSSRKLREEFAKFGVEAAGPQDEVVRLATVRLIADLQLGKLEGAAGRLGTIAKSSFKRQFGMNPVVCLACTELPLAFQDQKTATIFELDGILYINTSMVHINAALAFAFEQGDEEDQ